MIWRSGIYSRAAPPPTAPLKTRPKLLISFEPPPRLHHLWWPAGPRGTPLWARLFILLALTVTLQAANVTGRIDLRDSQDSAVRKKKDYSGVVVWLDPANGNSTRAPARTAPAHARMAQKDKTFTPHLLAIQVGTTVDFPNFDPIFHNAFSNYNGQLFDVSLYPPGTSRSVRFTRPGVVRVFCNIHAAMSAVIVVLATPYFDITRRDGSFSLAGAPAGDYTLRVFHERATPATLDVLTRRVTAIGESVALPLLPISESGYLAVPHKDKFGREYAGEPDERGVYPAVRK